MKSTCLICERIKKIKENENLYFVIELKTGYVVLGDNQFYKGYTLFLSKKHVNELHDLTPEFHMMFLKEMSLVAQAVFNAFHPRKLNYELLGNTHPHLHWHIFPRYENDPNVQQPVWVIKTSIRNADNTKPEKKELEKLKKKLFSEIYKLLK